MLKIQELDNLVPCNAKEVKEIFFCFFANQKNKVQTKEISREGQREIWHQIIRDLPTYPNQIASDGAWPTYLP